MNPRQASVVPNPLLPTMAYTQQPTYANHPSSAVPPAGIYSMGGMPGGQQTQYRMLTGPPSAIAGHGGPLGSGQGGPVGLGRGGAMPMAMNVEQQGLGTVMPLRYGQPQMGIARGTPNGMVQTSPGRGIGMPGAVGGTPGMRLAYAPGMNLPPGTRVMAAPGGMSGHPGPQYTTLVNQHGHVVSFAQMPQSQQQHTNPNGPGGPGQSPAHMLIPQQQAGGPPQQPLPLGGPGMTHTGGPGPKIYQQQQAFMGGMTPGSMGALPPPSGRSPVRNPSPNAATPANAPTPGGPGAGRGMTKPPTPANAQTPFASANASTPGARPGTASGQPNPASYTPRMTAAEAMAGAGVGVQSSPGAMQRNPTTNMGLQQQQQLQAQQQQQQHAQQAHLSQPGGPPPQSGGPGGSEGPMDHSVVYRTTPADMVIERSLQMYGSSQNQGQMEGVQYAMMGPNPGQVTQQQQRQQRMNPPQGMIAPGPLQPHHTGGSISSQASPLAPQPTGGVQPLVPQHTGGSMQDSAMNGPGGAVTAAGGRTSIPSTPQMASRQANMSMSGGPTGMMTSGSVSMPMGAMPGMPAMQGYPMGAGMAPPPPRNEGFRSLPMELSDVNATTMGFGGMMGVRSSRHAFGVLRLLKFSSQMKELSGYNEEKWSPIIAENFTENATLSFRAQRETKQHTNTFVHLPFPHLVRFFATLTQSNINRMSLILDGAIESQDGQEYTVYCPTARWPMYYDNGYILELNGVLKARCKTVPVVLPGSDTGRAPSNTPRMSSTIPANSNINGLGSSPSSSNNMHTSPTNKPPAAGNISNGSETKSFTTQNVPYMVKIDELSFDSGSVNKLINVSSGSEPRPEEPDNLFGVPRMTMRMIEISEGIQALEPMFYYESTQNMGVLSALNNYAVNYEQGRGQGQAGPSRESPDEQYTDTHFPGQGMEWMKTKDAMVAVKDMLYSGIAMRAPLSFDDLNPSGSPSTLSANVMQRMSDIIEPSSNTTSEPTASPLLVPKTSGKKNAAPGSPTKAAINGTTDKDKGGGKRKNTNDVEGRATRRKMTRNNGPKGT